MTRGKLDVSPQEWGPVEVFDREPSEVRVPRAALEAMAAALSVRTVAMGTWPDGIEWMYPLGTWDEPHLEGFAGPGLRGRAPRSETGWRVWRMPLRH